MINNVFRLKTEAFVLREAGNELVLVPLTNDIVDMTNVMTLNEVASEVLQALDGKKTLKEICESIIVKYNVEENIFERDVVNFINNAIERGIIEQIYF